ncbi:PREDICTED: PWWP domain-containing protein MUM1 [Acanthisitta chloris]|uniref:PWWP domain-containing protein MUM1 n=1 Tax=Acanthisitta chloris TaxID=57068 RepID=UPI0004F0F554|nr:PREDICTED: PWWP domain-containing protein MUM1 [Acanthisitta chloris]
MTDQEFVLCKWRKRLWPARILSRPGASRKIAAETKKEPGLKAEILGLENQVSVSCVGCVPLTEERIEDIAASLEQKEDVNEAVEELKYRRSLKIAMDILHQSVSGRQVAGAEGPNPEFSQENGVGSAPSTPSRRCVLGSCLNKLERVGAKRNRKPKTNCGLKGGTKAQPQGVSVATGVRVRARGSRTNPSRCVSRDLCDPPTPENHNCRRPEPKSPPRQRKIQPKLLIKPKPGDEISPKPKEGQSQQGRTRWSGAGSALPRRNGSSRDQAQPDPGEGSLPVPWKSGRRGSLPGRTFLVSSCKSASDELEQSISSESESLVKQLDGRRKAEGGKQLHGTGMALSRDRKYRSPPGSSPGPSGAFPQPQEEEHKDPSSLPGNKAKHIQLPDSEEDEGLESLEMPFRKGSSESSLPLSALAEEEEDYFPRVLSHREPQSIEEGILVWCKLRRYPYWPAVVKAVKRKQRKACVLFIDGTTNERKKGFSVSVKNLKHFDCEEKQEFIEQAKKNYRQEIEWCICLISDYRIRVGCHSFTGSFLEYFAADISSPVRKGGYQSLVQMTFPNAAEEGVEENSSDTSPQKPLKKLLPDRTRAARDKENKKLVEFIVKTKGAEEHLLAILKSRKQSRWLKKFLNSSQYVTCVETYLEDEEQLDLVVNYLKEVYREMDTKILHQVHGDSIKFISDVLLPEAIIYAIAAVDDIDYQKAEEKYIKGPSVSKREREMFDEEILERKKRKANVESMES